MTHYPVFLPERSPGDGRRSEVALRKTRGLLEAGAHVAVIAREWEADFKTLPLRLVSRRFRASGLANHVLVFAATNDRLTNRRIGVAAKAKGIIANVADSAEECNFIVPARVQSGAVQIAISPAEGIRVSRPNCGRSAPKF